MIALIPPESKRASATLHQKAASLRQRLEVTKSKTLEPRRLRRHMPAVQCHPHAVLVIDPRSRRPVDVLRIQHPTASTGQRVSDPAILVLIVPDRQHRARLQDEHRSTRRCRSRKVVGHPCNQAGISWLRNLHRRRYIRSGSSHTSANRETRRGVHALRVIRFVLRTAEEMPSRSERLRHLRYLYVIHQTQAEHRLALQRRA